jgi:pre-60S factor REI1
MSSVNNIFTCVTCNVAFNDPELQRDHYKTDWHRYNLKRKVAELPPVSVDSFQEKVQLLKNQEAVQSLKVEEMFCKLCQKHFNSQSHANHVQSNKHKELAASTNLPEDQYIIKSDRLAKKKQQIGQEIQKQTQAEQVVTVEEIAEEDGLVDEKDWEDVGDEDEDMINESEGIDLNTCLFCDHKSESLIAKCEHMAKEHSFFIPDSDHVADLEGLMKFLGIKVGAYHVCTWCSTKMYRDVGAVQKHMRDKGHQKMKFEGDTLLEYVDFYTFPGSEDTIDEEYDIVNQSADMTIVSLGNGGDQESYAGSSDLTDELFELVLPSGNRIGHRSLFKYYKQSFGHRNLELKQKSNISLRDKYKAISSNGVYTRKFELLFPKNVKLRLIICLLSYANSGRDTKTAKGHGLLCALDQQMGCQARLESEQAAEARQTPGHHLLDKSMNFKICFLFK